MFNPRDMIYTEKYRPKKVSEMVGEFRDRILQYLANPKALPNFLLFSRTPGTGKCLKKDEIILTKNGLTTFEDYAKENNIKKRYTELKDDIYDVENKFVKSSFFYKSKADIVKFTTEKGFELSGTKEHKIKIFNEKQGFIWRKISQLHEDDYIPIFFKTEIFGKNKEFDYSVFDKIKKEKNNTREITIKKPKIINKDIAFLAGVIVANGSFDGTTISISTHKLWLHKKIIKIVKKNFGINAHIFISKEKEKSVGIKIYSGQLVNFFEYIIKMKKTISHYKEIPKIIFESDKDIQMNYLYGYMEDSGLNDDGNLIMGTVSHIMAKQLQILYLNLGFILIRHIQYSKEHNYYYNMLRFSVEHGKEFIKYFNGVYKNKKVSFNKNIGSTNILGYKSIISNFIRNKRKEYEITKKISKQNKLGKVKILEKLSIDRFKKNIDIFIEKEPYLEDLKILRDNWVYLDKVKSLEYEKKQDVYDFHIPNTHSFYANGMINHNTTLAKAIINELGCDYIAINSSDERGVDTIRDKIKDFAMTMSSKPGLKRCVFLDEFDGTTRIAQESLRTMMEEFSSNTFFILSANVLSRVIEPIQSRCVVISFGYPDKEEVKKYLQMIITNEDMKWNEEGLDRLISFNFPSIRNAVIALQDLKTQGKAVIPENIRPANEVFDKLWGYLKEKRWLDIKKEVLESTLNPRELNTYFWQKALEESNIKLIQLTCRNEKDMVVGADPKIVFITSLIEAVKIDIMEAVK